MILFPILILIFTIVISRLVTKSWLSPCSFFSLFGLFIISIPILLSPEYIVKLNGIWILTIIIMANCAGSLFAVNNNYNQLQNKTNHNLKFQFFQLIFVGISFLGIILLLSHSMNNYQVTSLADGVFWVPNLISLDRYAGMINYPLVIKLSLYCVYPSSLLGGVIMGFSSKKYFQKFHSILPIIFAVIIGIIEATRYNIILSIVLFTSGFLSARATQNKKINSFELIIASSSLIFGFTSIFILVQWLRQGMDPLIFELIINRISAYYFGYLSAFSQWVESVNLLSFSGGLITFAGPLNILGAVDRSFGFYEPIVIAPGVSTNIFTAYRGLISDFTVFGVIVIFFIVGFLTQIIFNYAKNGRLFAIVPLSIFYAFIIYSPIISIFHYNSIIMSWIFLTLPFLKGKNGNLDINS